MDKILKKAKIMALRDETLVTNSKVQDVLRKEGIFCDLILRCKEGSRINVHKNVMSAASGFFKDLLTSGLKESSTGLVELEHISGYFLEKVVTFIYLGELKPDSAEEVAGIMKHAMYFRVPKLIEVCALFLEMCITDLSCIQYWRLARDCSSERFADSCVSYILTSDGGQLFSQLLNNFTVKEMQTLLENDRLTGTEKEIFLAVLKWAKCRTATDNTTDFLATFSKVVEFIRFPLMEKNFLSSVLSNPDLVKDEDLIEKISECVNNSEGPPLFSKCTTPRIGLRKLELVALYGGGVLKIPEKGIPQHLVNKNYTKKVHYGYTMFGNNFVLICGGYDGASSKDDAQYFSPITRKFYKFPKMPRLSDGHCCAAIDNKIYACGIDNSNIVQVFDLDRGEWHDGPYMNMERNNFGLTVVNNALYAMGGEDFTVEMMDPRNSVGWTNIFEKFNDSYHIKCVSIKDNIYCFTSDREFIFDVRMNKLRHWGCDIDMFEEDDCKFSVCEINGEIGIFAAIDKRFNFFRCDTDGEVTLKVYLDEMTCKYPAIVSMYC